MESPRQLPPLLVGDGTLTHPRDMVRALETVETFAYRYLVDGDQIASGRATLVRIMLDDISASTLVNGCLFLNVASFTYLNFRTSDEGQTRFELYTNSSMLEITPLDEPEMRSGGQRQVIRLIDESVFEGSSFVSLDDEDEDD